MSDDQRTCSRCSREFTSEQARRLCNACIRNMAALYLRDHMEEAPNKPAKAYVIMTADTPHEVVLDEVTAKRRVAELSEERKPWGELKYRYVHHREVPLRTEKPMSQDEYDYKMALCPED